MSRPARIVLAGVLGTAYGPIVVTASSVIGTLVLAIAQGREDLVQTVVDLPTLAIAILPIFGLTLGYLACGVGAIVGVACTAIDGGIAAGLEWAFVAGLGVVVGIGIRYARLELLIPGLVGGVITGGSVGLLTWFLYTERRLHPLTARSAIVYAVGLVLIAAYVWFTFDAVVTVLIA